jgi:hypothetical protein
MTPPALTLPDDDCKLNLLLSSLGTGETDEIHPTGNYVGIDGDPVFQAPIFQTINGLIVGETYALEFYQAAAQQNGVAAATTEQWQVSLGGDTQNSSRMSIPGGGFWSWSVQTMDFTATSPSEVLNFMALGTGVPPVALLADVSLNAVPEPESWARPRPYRLSPRTQDAGGLSRGRLSIRILRKGGSSNVKLQPLAVLEQNPQRPAPRSSPRTRRSRPHAGPDGFARLWPLDARFSRA